MLMHPHTFGVTTGHESRTGRRTNRRSDHKAGELPAFGGKAVDVGGFDLFRAEATEVAVSLVINKDEDKVGFTRMSKPGEKQVDE